MESEKIHNPILVFLQAGKIRPRVDGQLTQTDTST